MGKYINKFISIIVSICLIVTNILSASYGKNFLATPGINSTWIPVYTHMGGATIAYKLLNYLLDADEINEDINIMITYLCNFDCSICLSAKMRKMREQKHAEKKALYSLFDQLYGFKKVHLVGAGEPLFYGMNKISYENVDQDFIDILNYAAARIGEVQVCY